MSAPPEVRGGGWGRLATGAALSANACVNWRQLHAVCPTTTHARVDQGRRHTSQRSEASCMAPRAGAPKGERTSKRCGRAASRGVPRAGRHGSRRAATKPQEAFVPRAMGVGHALQRRSRAARFQLAVQSGIPPASNCVLRGDTDFSRFRSLGVTL